MASLPHKLSTISIVVLVSLLISGAHCSYFNSQSQQLLEPIEQKYESTETDESEYLSPVSSAVNDQSSGSTYELNQAYSQLAPSQVKGYRSENSDNYSQLSQSLFSDTSSYSGYKSQPAQQLDTGSEPLTKITRIPSGSMFSLSDKGTGGLEYESPFSKQAYPIVFRTQSMPVKIKQQHQTLPAPEVEFVRSQEEAHRIKHEVIRPVIQEVHEIIQPYRRVVQEVRPVIENVHTIVSKGESRNQGGNGQGSNNGQNGSGYGGGNGGHGQSSGGYSSRGNSNHGRTYQSQNQMRPMSQYRSQANNGAQYSQPQYSQQYSATSRMGLSGLKRY